MFHRSFFGRLTHFFLLPEGKYCIVESNFGTLPDSITELESSKISLAGSMQIVETEKLNMQQASSQIRNHYHSVFEKKKTLQNKATNLKQILEEGGSDDRKGLPDNMNINDIAYFKRAPITSVEVEGSF